MSNIFEPISEVSGINYKPLFSIKRSIQLRLLYFMLGNQLVSWFQKIQSLLIKLKQNWQWRFLLLIWLNWFILKLLESLARSKVTQQPNWKFYGTHWKHPTSMFFSWFQAQIRPHNKNATRIRKRTPFFGLLFKIIFPFFFRLRTVLTFPIRIHS